MGMIYIFMEKKPTTESQRVFNSADMKSSQKCFKCHGFGHVQVQCPNRRAMTVQEIQEIKKEDNKQGDGEKYNQGEEEHVIVKADEGELLCNSSESRDEKAIKKSLFLNKVGRYTLFSRPDPYILDFELVEELDYGSEKHKHHLIPL